MFGLFWVSGELQTWPSRCWHVLLLGQHQLLLLGRSKPALKLTLSDTEKMFMWPIPSHMQQFCWSSCLSMILSMILSMTIIHVYPWYPWYPCLSMFNLHFFIFFPGWSSWGICFFWAFPSFEACNRAFDRDEASSCVRMQIASQFWGISWDLANSEGLYGR